MTAGDRVETPLGPATVVELGTHRLRAATRWHAYGYVIVELDELPPPTAGLEHGIPDGVDRRRRTFPATKVEVTQ